MALKLFLCLWVFIVIMWVFVLSSCGSEYIIDCEACPEIPITEQQYLDNLARKDEKIRNLESEVLSWRASNNAIFINWTNCNMKLVHCSGNLKDCDLALAFCEAEWRPCHNGKAYCRKNKKGE